MNVGKLHTAFNCDIQFGVGFVSGVYGYCIFGFRELLFLIQEFKYSLGRSRCLLEDIGYIGYLGDRLRKLSDILEKGLYIPYGDDLIRRKKASEDTYCNISQPLSASLFRTGTGTSSLLYTGFHYIRQISLYFFLHR